MKSSWVRTSRSLCSAASEARPLTVVTTDFFYEYSGDPRQRWIEAGAGAVEMEACALFTLGSRLGVAMACLLVVGFDSHADESLPARMTLAASRVPVGEKIVVRLTLPSDRRYGGGQFSAFVGLYLPSDGINDWKASADFGWDGLSGVQVLELVPPARLPPGRYEVRLNPERFASAAQITLPVELYFAKAPAALDVGKFAYAPGEAIGIESAAASARAPTATAAPPISVAGHPMPATVTGSRKADPRAFSRSPR